MTETNPHTKTIDRVRQLIEVLEPRHPVPIEELEDTLELKPHQLERILANARLALEPEGLTLRNYLHPFYEDEDQLKTEVERCALIVEKGSRYDV